MTEQEIKRWMSQNAQQIVSTQLQIARLQKRLESLIAQGLSLEDDMAWYRLWHTQNYL